MMMKRHQVWKTKGSYIIKVQFSYQDLFLCVRSIQAHYHPSALSKGVFKEGICYGYDRAIDFLWMINTQEAPDLK